MAKSRALAGGLTQRERRRIERCERILVVAARSFLENGYHGTTMSSIAAELKGSKETLWRHFSSKEQLFAAFLERATQTFHDELVIIFNPSIASTDVIELVCTSFLRKILSPDMIALYRIVVSESGHHPEMGRIFYDRVQSRMETMLRSLLQERFGLDDDVADDGMKLLLHLCTGNLFARALVGTELLNASNVSVESKKIANILLTMFELRP